MKTNQTRSWIFNACAIAGIAYFGPTKAHAADETPIETTVAVDAATTLRTMEPRRIGGTNIAMWTDPATFASPLVRQWVADLHGSYIRLPGGSWSNEVYWNGNGVRDASGNVDTSKVGPDGFPAVDYSGYAPSFRVDDKTLHPSNSGWHSASDVKTLHEFIEAIPGAEPITCPNAGTGRAIDAAEWVKWADKMGYHTRTWEIGNELGGFWESGTTLPFGKGTLTGPVYAKRFNDFAAAMRAVDPKIRTGGCAFAEDIIRDCGENVNFVSIHNYPGSATMTEAQLFANVKDTVAHDTEQVKGWIKKYQPQREKQIELAYSEWNIGGGISAAGMLGGLWASVYLGEMAQHGIDFATQWDAFTTSGPDGHALFYSHDGNFVRESEYYALWFWNHYMGDRLVPAKSGNDEIYTYASRSDDAVYVMLLNTDRDRPAKINVQLSGFTPAASAEMATLSGREYYWNTVSHLPQWSTGPRFEEIKSSASTVVTLAPFSITYVRIPDQAKPALSPMAQVALAAAPPVNGSAQLQFAMPDEVYAGDVLGGELMALTSGLKGPYLGSLPPAALTADGPAELDRAAARLDESLGRFSIKPTKPGQLTLTAQSGGLTATHTITVKPSIIRPVIIWDFTTPPVTDKETFTSEYSLSEDLTRRANRAVARIDLPAAGTSPGTKEHDVLLKIQKFPEDSNFKKENIRGVIFDMMTSADFSCDDPDASVSVVMQGPANWWMPLGNVLLKDTAVWKTQTIAVTRDDYIKAVPTVGNVLFVLNSNKPVKGSIFFDHVGVLTR